MLSIVHYYSSIEVEPNLFDCFYQSIEARQCQDDLKKSLAASRRHAHKNIPVHTNGCSNSKVPYVIRGNFHQGDLQLFSAESAGRQCSCNALIMLCIVENVIDTLAPYHLDQVLEIGDKLYKTRSHELEAANELHPGKLLDQTQMPTELTIDECFYRIVYKQENFRHGRLDNDPLQNKLNTWLQYASSKLCKRTPCCQSYSCLGFSNRCLTCCRKFHNFL